MVGWRPKTTRSASSSDEKGVPAQRELREPQLVRGETSTVARHQRREQVDHR